MKVERTDFVSVFTQDIPRAKEFYSGTLGLEFETKGDSDLEFRCGQVTLDVFDPSRIGQPFAPPAGLALRVREAIETGVCRMASFEDADGDALLLHRRIDA